MTHRERVLTAIAHQQPDRVPIDLGATRDSTIVIGGYERLKDHFGLTTQNEVISQMMQVVRVDERILEALDIDVRAVLPGGPDRGGDVSLKGDRYRDKWGVERVRPEGGIYYDQVTFPLSGEITVKDISNHPWPDPDDPGRIRGLKEQARHITHDLGCAAVLNLPSGFVHVSQYLRGFEDWYVDCASDPNLAGALFDAVLEVNLAVCKRILREVGDHVDVLMASDDLGLQNGLMISPEAYRAMFKPRQARYFQLLHDHSPAKVLYHTCGSVVDIIDDLIEIGVDILNPVQVSAKGMDPVVLKERYGDRLSFWGGIDTQHVLPRGSVEEVKAEVERRIDQFGCGGGYVLAAVHNIQPDVPLSNVLAMFEHARTYGV
jgi:uroporphyrinogen decarboxylase